MQWGATTRTQYQNRKIRHDGTTSNIDIILKCILKIKLRISGVDSFGSGYVRGDLL